MMHDDLRLPPHSIEAEQSVLGAVMLDNTVLDSINGDLAAEHFYAEAHRIIFRHQRELRDARQPVDVVTLSTALEAAGKLEYIGGQSYLGQLVQNVPTAANAAHYAGIVRERAKLRAVMGTANALLDAALNPMGRTADDVLADARVSLDNIATAGASALPLVWANDATVDDAGDYIVKGIIARGELGVIYGAPKSGKTFLALDLALSVAALPEWFGHRVNVGTVIYVAAEMGRRVLRRVRAWIDDRDAYLPRLAVIPVAVNLLDERAVARLMERVRAIAAAHRTPVLVVIDTLARSMTGGDENSAMDMGKALHVADRLRDEFNTATMIVHHEGKTAKNGARGSSALLGAVDTMIRVDHDQASGARSFEVEWCRDGEAGRQHGFALRMVDLGEDYDGDRITTCMVDAADTPTPAESKPRPKRLRPAAMVALRALRDAISDHGETLPATSAIPPGARGVTLDAWRARYHLIVPLESTDAGERDKEAGARKKEFQRARSDLIAAEMAGTINNLWWLS